MWNRHCKSDWNFRFYEKLIIIANPILNRQCLCDSGVKILNIHFMLFNKLYL